MRFLTITGCIALAACDASTQVAPQVIVVRSPQQLEVGEGLDLASAQCPSGTGAAFSKNYWNVNVFSCEHAGPMPVAWPVRSSGSHGALISYPISVTAGSPSQ